MVEVVTGDLLKADTDALVNTVNTVGIMGKGIALQFKKAFPENYEAYRKACDTKEVAIGRVLVFETESLHNPRYIINFPTKVHWRQPSRLEYVQAGLEDLVQVISKLHIESIALPPLGCGNGGLEWPQVSALIRQYLDDLRGVKVLVFAPQGAPAAAAMVDKTGRPAMTPGRAAVLGLMKRYAALGYGLTLLEVQKLVYFLQVAGEPLPRIEFAKQKYGPYADALRHVLERMETHYIQGYGDGTNKPTTPIDLLNGAGTQAEEFVAAHVETKQRFERVTRLIKGFETPYGMELLASVHWVATHDDPAARHDPVAAVKALHSWSTRKQERFQPEHIEMAWHRLHEQDWLN